MDSRTSKERPATEPPESIERMAPNQQNSKHPENPRITKMQDPPVQIHPERLSPPNQQNPQEPAPKQRKTVSDWAPRINRTEGPESTISELKPNGRSAILESVKSKALPKERPATEPPDQ